MKFIKIYHRIWSLNLSPNAFRAYCSLLRFMNADAMYANVSMRKLAGVSGISEKSVSRGIAELSQKKAIEIVKKSYHGHRLANGYRISQYGGKYTKLPVEVLGVPLTASGFMAYAYIMKCADSQRKAFPSLSNISKAIGITVQTVISQVKAMVRIKLLNKFHQVRKNRSFGHNLYHLLECAGIFAKKEKTRLDRASSPSVTETVTSKHKISICLKTCFVKRISAFLSFFSKGVLKFCPDMY